MKKTAIGVALLLLVLACAPFDAQAQQRGAERVGRLMIGAHAGLNAGTADGSVFAMGFNADYHLDNSFSVGPMLYFGIGDDLFQVGISGQAKYVFLNPRFPNVKPHLQGGLGFLSVSLDKPGGPNDDDLGFIVPFGGGVDVELEKNILLGSTLLLNFTDADVSGQKNIFMTWFFGLRFLL